MQTDISKKKMEIKYLVFDSIDKNKELLKKYADVWDGIKCEIKTSGGNENCYEKDYMKLNLILMIICH